MRVLGRRRLSPAMRAALLAAAGRHFAALGPAAIDRRLADRLARRGLMRVEWCAVLTEDGARAAQALVGGPASRSVTPTRARRRLAVADAAFVSESAEGGCAQVGA